MFLTFLEEGFWHILDLNGLDHLMFLIALGVVYNLSKWKELIWVLTAFTIAHSLSLAFALFEIISIPTKYVEFLIPITILFTCFENVLFGNKHFKSKVLFAGLFGLIHGMGFSNLLRELFLGMDYNPFLSLFPFNLGIEIAQIFIILILLLILRLFYKFRIVSQIVLIRIVSILIGIQSIIWITNRFPF